MHYETLIYIALQASASLNPAPGFLVPDFPSLSREWSRQVSAEGLARPNLLQFDETTVELGHDDSERADGEAYDPDHAFGWDVENPRREIAVAAFKLSPVPVSNREYLEFLVAQNVQPNSALFPASWSFEASSDTSHLVHNTQVKTLYGLVDFEYCAEWPVTASAVQLGAYAKVGSMARWNVLR